MSDGMHEIACHFFKSLTPGEYCCRDDRPCEGVSSLVELCSMAETVREGDTGISHWGGITMAEKTQMQNAAQKLREHMEKVFGR